MHSSRPQRVRQKHRRALGLSHALYMRYPGCGMNQEGVLASLGKFRSLYQTLPPYQQREGIRLVVANVKISEDALEISILGRPAPEEALEKLRAPGIHAPRRSERSTWLPGLMSQSAVVRDYRVLEISRWRANRLVLTVSG